MASLPALAAARLLYEQCGPTSPYPITISGGINDQTAGFLRQEQYRFIAGVGIGTMARKTVWPYLESQDPTGQVKAQALVQPFKQQVLA